MTHFINKAKGLLIAGTVALTFGLVGPAQAITIDFSSGNHVNSNLYVEDNLTVVSQVNHIHIDNVGGSHGKVLRNHANCCSTPYLLSFDMPVNLITVDFKGTGGNLFTSNKGGSFSYPGSTGWVNPGTVVDPLFMGITSITWAQTSGWLKIDNLVYEKVDVAPIPEPSTMLLLGTGLAGIVGWRYRKQQA